MDAQDMKSDKESAGAGDLTGAASDKGPARTENQDAYWIPDTETNLVMGALYLVADGVGGQEGGADAAKLAAQTVSQKFYDSRRNGGAVRDALPEALQEANLAVYEEAQQRQLRRMGATFVAAVIENGQLTIAHVGDARAYLIRQNEMRRLTRDDSWVQKQVEAGLITELQAAKHEFRNIVTQVLGNKPEVNVHLSKTLPLQPDDLILLCSDGLYDALPDSKMLSILTNNSPSSAAQQLVNAAIVAEAKDNITAVVIKPEPLTSAEEPTLPVLTADQPTVLLALADEPTLPPALPPPSPTSVEKSKSKVPSWLIILALTAVILILGAIFMFWLRNRDLDSTVESTAGADLIDAVLETTPTAKSADALRPAPTMTADENSSQTAPAAANQQTETATALPPTPTLLPTPTLEATREPRGCVNDSVFAYVWTQAQLDAGSCDSTPFELAVGDEVRILEETAVTAEGACSGVPFIKIQSIADPELEGWVAEGAIDLLDPGLSCNP